MYIVLDESAKPNHGHLVRSVKTIRSRVEHQRLYVHKMWLGDDVYIL